MRTFSTWLEGRGGIDYAFVLSTLIRPAAGPEDFAAAGDWLIEHGDQELGKYIASHISGGHGYFASFDQWRDIRIDREDLVPISRNQTMRGMEEFYVLHVPQGQVYHLSPTYSLGTPVVHRQSLMRKNSLAIKQQNYVRPTGQFLVFNARTYDRIPWDHVLERAVPTPVKGLPPTLQRHLIKVLADVKLGNS